MLLIGLMSGTSADGVDAALVKIDERKGARRVQLLKFVAHPYTDELRAAVLKASKGRVASGELCALDHLLGRRYAEAANSVAAAAGVAVSAVAAIACHGQTIWHQPDPLCVGGGTGRGTLQIGCPAVIAARTGIPVICDFRSADMAAGGQGAPLVPFADWQLFRSPTESRAVLNIGGIANVTLLPAGCSLDQVTAFDTGPGNMVIDALVSDVTGGRLNMDVDGKLAANGRPCAALLKRLLRHAYFRREPPKSTGREMFGSAYVSRIRRLADGMALSDEDLIATATALTAETIARALSDWPPPQGKINTLVVGGGGARNPTLREMIAGHLPGVRVCTSDEFGIPVDAKEAIAFALLGYETLNKRPSNVPSATGAVYPAILGSITQPPPYRVMRERAAKTDPLLN